MDPLHGAEMMLFTERLLVSVLSHQLHDKAGSILIHVYNTFDACLGGEVFTVAIRNKHNMQIFSKSDFQIMPRTSISNNLKRDPICHQMH